MVSPILNFDHRHISVNPFAVYPLLRCLLPVLLCHLTGVRDIDIGAAQGFNEFIPFVLLADLQLLDIFFIQAALMIFNGHFLSDHAQDGSSPFLHYCNTQIFLNTRIMAYQVILIQQLWSLQCFSAIYRFSSVCCTFCEILICYAACWKYTAPEQPVVFLYSSSSYQPAHFK